MSSDGYFDAYERGRNLGVGAPVESERRRDKKAVWRDEWSRERFIRDKGYVCAKCMHFTLEADHPLSKTFADLGMCNKFGSHRFGSASCNMGLWNGRRRPDSGSSMVGVEDT